MTVDISDQRESNETEIIEKCFKMVAGLVLAGMLLFWRAGTDSHIVGEIPVKEYFSSFSAHSEKAFADGIQIQKGIQASLV